MYRSWHRENSRLPVARFDSLRPVLNAGCELCLVRRTARLSTPFTMIEVAMLKGVFALLMVILAFAVVADAPAQAPGAVVQWPAGMHA